MGRSYTHLNLEEHCLLQTQLEVGLKGCRLLGQLAAFLSMQRRQPNAGRAEFGADRLARSIQPGEAEIESADHHEDC